MRDIGVFANDAKDAEETSVKEANSQGSPFLCCTN
jgi:hypothetical protein